MKTINNSDKNIIVSGIKEIGKSRAFDKSRLTLLSYRVGNIRNEYSNKVIADITRDNVISPVEKTSLKNVFDGISAEYGRIADEFDTYSAMREWDHTVDEQFNAYKVAFEALELKVLDILSDMTTSYELTDSSLDTLFDNYYGTKNTYSVSVVGFVTNDIQTIDVRGRVKMRITSSSGIALHYSTTTLKAHIYVDDTEITDDPEYISDTDFTWYRQEPNWYPSHGANSQQIEIGVADLVDGKANFYCVYSHERADGLSYTTTASIVVELTVTGQNGYSSAQVRLMKKSQTEPNTYEADGGSDATYTFSTGSVEFSGSNAGWSVEPPTGDGVLYVIYASAISQSDTDTIPPNVWTSPVVLSTEGAKGDNGYSATTVFIFKASPTQPRTPSGTVGYNFTNGTLSGLSDGWSSSISSQDRVWVSTATAYSRTDSANIDPSKWETPVLYKDKVDGTSSTYVSVSGNSFGVEVGVDGSVRGEQNSLLTFRGYVGDNPVPCTATVTGLPNGMEYTSSPSSVATNGNIIFYSHNGKTLGGGVKGDVTIAFSINSKTLYHNVTWEKVYDPTHVLADIEQAKKDIGEHNTKFEKTESQIAAVAQSVNEANEYTNSQIRIVNDSISQTVTKIDSDINVLNSSIDEVAGQVALKAYLRKSDGTIVEGSISVNVVEEDGESKIYLDADKVIATGSIDAGKITARDGLRSFGITEVDQLTINDTCKFKGEVESPVFDTVIKDSDPITISASERGAKTEGKLNSAVADAVDMEQVKNAILGIVNSNVSNRAAKRATGTLCGNGNFDSVYRIDNVSSSNNRVANVQGAESYEDDEIVSVWTNTYPVPVTVSASTEAKSIRHRYLKSVSYEWKLLLTTQDSGAEEPEEYEGEHGPASEENVGEMYTHNTMITREEFGWSWRSDVYVCTRKDNYSIKTDSGSTELYINGVQYTTRTFTVPAGATIVAKMYGATLSHDIYSSITSNKGSVQISVRETDSITNGIHFIKDGVRSFSLTDLPSVVYTGTNELYIDGERHLYTPIGSASTWVYSSGKLYKLVRFNNLSSSTESSSGFYTRFSDTSEIDVCYANGTEKEMTEGKITSVGFDIDSNMISAIGTVNGRSESIVLDGNSFVAYYKVSVVAISNPKGVFSQSIYPKENGVFDLGGIFKNEVRRWRAVYADEFDGNVNGSTTEPSSGSAGYKVWRAVFNG